MKVIGGARPTGYIGPVIGKGSFDANAFDNAWRWQETWYEAAEPKTAWAMERWPGDPRTGGRAHRGLVRIGPALGALGNGEGMSGGTKLLILLGMLGISSAAALWLLKRHEEKYS